MKVIHSAKKLKIEKEISNDAGFILTNNSGGYLFLGSEPKSRYEGFFCFANEKMFRVVEGIVPAGSGKVESVVNKFCSVERKRGNLKERFFLPRGKNSLVYEIDKLSDIDVFLDVKESYDNREFGRFYEISVNNGTAIIKFAKEFSAYVAVKADDIKEVRLPYDYE